VGLGGGIGAGKSAVGLALEALGAGRLDTDAVYHELLAGDDPLREALLALLGPGVLDGQGRPARERMRAVLKQRPELFPRLDSLTHPRILAEVEARLEAPRLAGRPFVVIEVPLLFESGLDAWMDLNVYVAAPLEERFRRVHARSGLARADFDAILARQLPPEQASRRADLLIANDAGTGELRQRAAALYREIVARLA